MSAQTDLTTERSDEQSQRATGEPAPLRRARAVATLLDDAITVPVIGYRIGLDPILGVLPVVGDSVSALASLYVVVTGIRLGVPLRTTVAMLALVGIDWAVGSVPVLGTIADAVLKVNKRNVAAIERHVSTAGGATPR